MMDIEEYTYVFFHFTMLFPEMRAIACACTGTHARKFTCAISRMRKIAVFSLCFVIINMYSRRTEKLFIERFFIEDYMQ